MDKNKCEFSLMYQEYHGIRARHRDAQQLLDDLITVALRAEEAITITISDKGYCKVFQGIDD